jgi:repressor LexA
MTMKRERIKERRLNLGLTQTNIGNKLGVGKATIQKYEAGVIKSIDTDTFAKLADILDCSPLYLLGTIDTVHEHLGSLAERMGRITMLPVIGNVKAGVNSIAQEEVIEYYPVPSSLVKSGESYFCLAVEGDSMSPEINNGDLVVVKRQSSVDSNNLGVFLVDGIEGIVKRVKYDIDYIELHSVNPAYPVRRFDGIEVTRVFVVGKVISCIKRY